MDSSHDNPLLTEIEVESCDHENASTTASTLASDSASGANILRKKHIGRTRGGVWEVSGKTKKVEKEGSVIYQDRKNK